MPLVLLFRNYRYLQIFEDISNSFTDICNSFTDILKYLRISVIHLLISVIHLLISIIHLLISVIQLQISVKQLQISPILLEISVIVLWISAKQLNRSHLKWCSHISVIQLLISVMRITDICNSPKYELLPSTVPRIKMVGPHAIDSMLFSLI